MRKRHQLWHDWSDALAHALERAARGVVCHVGWDNAHMAWRVKPVRSTYGPSEPCS